MNLIYNISIHLFIIAMHSYALFSNKARLWCDGRRNLFQELSKNIKGATDIVWFHCASLGEFEQGRPIIEKYKKKFPKHKILLTFFSPSGYEVQKNYKNADWVFYMPGDTRKNAKRFISIIKPKKVIFIKYEFWFNYMTELKKQQINFYTVSAIFQKDQAFFKYKWFKNQLKNVSHFFVQDYKSKKLLANIGFSNCTVTGDSRFDRVITNTKNKKNIPLIELFSKNKFTIICGSSWPRDEKILLKYINKNPQYNYIIAPHELEKTNTLKQYNNAVLFSNANKNNILNSNVLIIDSIGLLSNIYQYGNIAYVGGGFDSGIHNILEAVAFGLPVIFGPNYKKFNEAHDLIKLNGAKSITNYMQLESSINSFKDYNHDIALNYIKEKKGATDKILSKI